MHRNSFSVFSRRNCSFSSFSYSIPLKSRNFNNLYPKIGCESRCINTVSVLFHNVHHVDCHDHRNSKLCKLRCKIKVSLKISSVNNIENSVGTLIYKIAAGNHFLKCIRRKGIYSRKVGYNYTVMLFELALLFFNGNTRPVSYKLI